MQMPQPDAGVIARRAEIIKAMQAVVSGEGVITDEDELRVYDHDGLMVSMISARRAMTPASGSAKTRDRNCVVVRRRGRVYVINKRNKRFKARQG